MPTDSGDVKRAEWVQPSEHRVVVVVAAVAVLAVAVIVAAAEAVGGIERHSSVEVLQPWRLVLVKPENLL